MEKSRLIIGGPTSVYPDIEVEIKGTVYIARLTRQVFEQLKALGEKIAEGKAWDASLLVYDQAAALTGAPPEVINALTIQEIRGIVSFVTDEAFKTVAGKTPVEDEKPASAAVVTPPEAIPQPKAPAKAIGKNG